MHTDRTTSAGRLRRLAEEVAEEAPEVLRGHPDHGALLDELDYALRPPVHEQRVPSYGAVILPEVDPSGWGPSTGLRVTSRLVDDLVDDDTRRFADGLSSWAVRRSEAISELVVFDRAAGSERDLVVLAAATEATLVQRHPDGTVRVVGPFGVARWDGWGWHCEPPVERWISTMCACVDDQARSVVSQLLEFAVHDLGARGIGALLVHHAGDESSGDGHEERLPAPPPLRIDRPFDLAPLRHVLAQVDGAAVFDRFGTLRSLGVRLVPSASAEEEVDALRGTRHTAARRYSYDDPTATVIVVSEDGPVSVLRHGEVQGRSPTD